MNFNQSFPEPATPVIYQIMIESENFVSKLKDYYERYAREDASETGCHGAHEFPVLDRSQQLGYPPLPDLMAQEPSLLEKLVKDWFNQDVLDRIIPGPEVGLPRFLVNSIGQVTVRNGHVQLEGKAYLHPMLAHDA